jgi:hypothetical protein
MTKHLKNQSVITHIYFIILYLINQFLLPQYITKNQLFLFLLY